MKLEKLDHDLSVCKVTGIPLGVLHDDFYFLGRTDEEISLVCLTEHVPSDVLECENGWKTFRIRGSLDFSLTGILAPIAKILADNQIGIFAVSTFNTDYILVKKENFEPALQILSDCGYEIV